MPGMAVHRKETAIPQIASERRLFISGLHSSVTSIDIFNRFESFGRIIDGAKGVTELGLDANGMRQSHATDRALLTMAAQGFPRIMLF